MLQTADTLVCDTSHSMLEDGRGKEHMFTAMCTANLYVMLDLMNLLDRLSFNHLSITVPSAAETRGLMQKAPHGAHSPVRGHPRGSKFVPLNSWGRVSY